MEGKVSCRKRGWWCAETVNENYKEYLREIWLHMPASSSTRQHCVKITCPIMKRDCFTFLSGMLYCRWTSHVILPLSPSYIYTHLLYIYLDAVIYCLIMWFQKIDWNCSLSFIKMDCSVNILWLASVSSPHSIWLSIPQQKRCLVLSWECMAAAVSITHLTASKRRIYFCKLAPV